LAIHASTEAAEVTLNSQDRVIGDAPSVLRYLRWIGVAPAVPPEP